jgi:hypothetical protein
MAGKTKKGSKKATKKAMKKGLNNSYNVNGGPDLMGLKSFMKPHGKVIIIIKKAGCPHCDTLDNDIVEPLLNSRERVHPIVQVQHDQVENIDFLRGLTIMGYPAVYELVKGFGKAPETGSINEIEEPRNLENMKEIASQPVSEQPSLPPSNTEETLDTSNDQDLPLSPEAEVKQNINLKNKGGLEAVLKNSMNNERNNRNNRNKVATPPRADNDMLNSQDPATVDQVNDFGTSTRGSKNINTNNMSNTSRNSNRNEFSESNTNEVPSNKKGAVGGALYESLLEASKQLAPVAILTTAAVASRLALSTRRSKRARRTRKN